MPLILIRPFHEQLNPLANLTAPVTASSSLRLLTAADMCFGSSVRYWTVQRVSVLRRPAPVGSAGGAAPRPGGAAWGAPAPPGRSTVKTNREQRLSGWPAPIRLLNPLLPGHDQAQNRRKRRGLPSETDRVPFRPEKTRIYRLLKYCNIPCMLFNFRCRFFQLYDFATRSLSS